MPRVIKRWLLAAALLSTGLAATAHETRPAFLEIRELRDGDYVVAWKQPAMGEMAVRLVPKISNGWLDHAPNEVDSQPGYRVERWTGRLERTDTLQGSRIEIEGLSQTITDALVSVTLRNGDVLHDVLNAGRTSLIVPANGAVHRSFNDYVALGVEHILTGFDHLLFVFGLILLVKSRLDLMKTVTAFTVAHSITLAAATFGWIRPDALAIEALVALSIVFLAVELAHRYLASTEARTSGWSLAVQCPWVMAFAFGLLHGFAFSGSLTDVGIPAGEIPWALLLFNSGVEIGQLMFIVVVLLAAVLLRVVQIALPGWTRMAASYAIGSLASFWFFERLLTAAIHTR